MPADETEIHPTVALSTKLEEQFIGPLAAMRGTLEIPRDHPDLSEPERERFVSAALRGCGRLEAGVSDLSSNVYAAGRQALAQEPVEHAEHVSPEHANRIRFIKSEETVEMDLRDLVLDSSRVVKVFFAEVERRVAESRRKWYFLVNHTRCSVWPEAWVAFAHCAKRIFVNYSLGTARYSENPADTTDPEMLPSREQAAMRIAEMRAGTQR